MTAPRFFSLLVAGVLSLSLALAVAKSKPKSKSQDKTSAKPSATPSPTPNQDWQVIKVGPRDYLSVDNIAKFYGLIGNVDSTLKTVVLNNGRNMLQVTLDSREVIVNGIRNWFCFPVIAHENKFLVSRIDLAKTIEPQHRPQMIQRSGKIQTIVLDPGHGGVDKGAATSSNPNATGFEIFSLTPRGAPSTNDDALSLHFVNMQAGSPMEAQSFELAAAVYHSMLGHVQEFDRGIKRARFAVLRRTNVPSILVEGGFLSETGDSKRI